MMAPVYFRNARMEAEHHVQAKIVRRSAGVLDVRIVRVFRGVLKPGEVLRLHVAVAGDGPIVLGSRLYASPAVAEQARFIEAFLDGDPPDVVMDQLKYLPVATRRPSGDPSQIAFMW
jgi:hypothetical protein